MKRNMLQISIFLPADAKGNPDWVYMEDSYKRFHLYDDDLFTIDRGTKLDKIRMSNMKPSVNFVGRVNANNGVTAYIDKIEGIIPYPAGYLTVSLGGEYPGRKTSQIYARFSKT